jgi:DNA-binding LacI/PurR family transcriptional regulator
MNDLGFAPKHMLIADKIRESIVSGKLAVGSRLMPDTELANLYKVNKKTVANGMAGLVAEGLISRSPGRGSIVIKQNITARTTRNAVGLLMLSQGDVYGNIAEVIVESLIKRGLYPVLINNTIFSNAISATSSRRLYTLIESILMDEPSGLIIDGDESVPFTLLERNIGRCKNIVFINRYQALKRIAGAKYVLTDYEEGGRIMARHLIEMGHQRITFFLNKESTNVGYTGSVQQQILSGIKEVCSAEKVEFNNQIPERLMAGETLDNVCAGFMTGKQRPTGAGAISDSAIFHHISPALTKIGFSIPEDISMVGFFNTPWSEKFTPPLTTVSINETAMAKLAVQMLTDEINEKEIKLKPELVERNSVARLEPKFVQDRASLDQR